MTEVSNSHRPAPPTGLPVDRKRPIQFRFEDKTGPAAEHNAGDAS